MTALENKIESHDVDYMFERCVYIGERISLEDDVRSFVSSCSPDVFFSGSLRASVMAALNRGSDGLVLIVDYDLFGGVADVVGQLIMLRKRKPDCSVVLLSRELSGNDFTTSRLPICDVSLRLPFGNLPKFDAICETVRTNNMIWRQRQHEMRKFKYVERRRKTLELARTVS
jgi:hypothetical protein